MGKHAAWELEQFESYLKDLEREIQGRPRSKDATLESVFGRGYREFLWSRFSREMLPTLRALHASRLAGSRPFPKTNRKRGRVLGPPMSARPRAANGDWLPINRPRRAAKPPKGKGPPKLLRRR